MEDAAVGFVLTAACAAAACRIRAVAHHDPLEAPRVPRVGQGVFLTPEGTLRVVLYLLKVNSVLGLYEGLFAHSEADFRRNCEHGRSKFSSQL